MTSWCNKVVLLKSVACYPQKRTELSYCSSEMEFKEFVLGFKSAKTRFKLSTGLNLKTFDPILSGTNLF